MRTCTDKSKHDQYHSSRALSQTAIGYALDCLARYKAWYDGVLDERTTHALSFGSAAHTLLFEPHVFTDRYAVTDLNLATKAGREFKEALPDGVEIIKESDYEHALLMAEAVREHPQGRYLFQDYMAEQPLFWIQGDIECKAKPDLVSQVQSLRICSDYKTTDSASISAIDSKMLRYGSHRQAAWYLDALALAGTPCDYFVFFFVEKTYPYIVTIREVDAATIVQGRRECAKAVALVSEAHRTGKFPCYSRDIVKYSLPAWAIQED